MPFSDYVFWRKRSQDTQEAKEDVFVEASPFSPEHVPKAIDTIVIGSGMGGSTCANMLAKCGQRVLLLEQHSTLGGCTHTFGHKNCEWDTGLHYTSRAMADNTTRPGAIMDFMTDGKQKWTILDDPYDLVVFNKEKTDTPPQAGLPDYNEYPFNSGGARVVEMISERIDPSLRPRVQQWLLLCNQIHCGFTALFLQLALPWPINLIFRGPVNRLYAFGRFTVKQAMHLVLERGWTAEQVLALGRKKQELVLPEAEQESKNPSIVRAQGVLCHPIGDYAVQPAQATLAAHGVTLMHYLDGGSYSVGPTQDISRRLAKPVIQNGGAVLVGVTVTRLLLSADQKQVLGVRVVRTDQLHQLMTKQGDSSAGEKEPGHPPPPCDMERDLQTWDLTARNVVCATSVYNLYSELLAPYPSLPSVRAYHDFPAKRSVLPAKGHIFLFCKLKGSPEELKLPKSNIWYFNKYKMDQAFNEYWADPTTVRPPTVYIGFPCTKDLTWSTRYPGVSNCILISDGLISWFEKWANQPVWRRGKDYEALKAKFQKILLEILYEVVPTVNGKVEFSHLGTPLTEEWFLHSYRGGSYGTLCVPEMFHPSRKNAAWTMTPRTPLAGLYMAGSDAFLPSVTGAMYGGLQGFIKVVGPLRASRMALKVMYTAIRHAREKDPHLSILGAVFLIIRNFIE
eukprot:gb/GEZN01001800.1/.p1 GENE.gb/GEZN01001800.1/~~gb/GEZN01001800.1/.p1  ORF type:complete len:678 (-),score=70.35 gb/GEZN01001800.1/:694-2727(-)